MSGIKNYDFDLSVFKFPKSGVKIWDSLALNIGMQGAGETEGDIKLGSSRIKFQLVNKCWSMYCAPGEFL
jgi:hypothetical protein